MRHGFAPYTRHLDNLFVPTPTSPTPHPLNLTMSTILTRSCWVPFRKLPIFSTVDDIFAPQIDQIYHFIQILLGPILNFERRTPADFCPECHPPPPPPPPLVNPLSNSAGNVAPRWVYQAILIEISVRL